MQNKTHLLFCLFFFVFLQEEHKLLHISREWHLRKPQQKARKCFKHSAQGADLQGPGQRLAKDTQKKYKLWLGFRAVVPQDSSWNSWRRLEFTIFGMFCPSQVLLENYMRFVAVLSLTEYGTRKQECWEFPEKSHSAELTSSKRPKKPSSFTSAAEGRFRSTLSIYYPFSGSFTWSTTTHSQFAPCQQQPASTAQKLGTGWIKLYQSNTDSSEIQHSLKWLLFSGSELHLSRPGNRQSSEEGLEIGRVKGLFKVRKAETRLKLWAG